MSRQHLVEIYETDDFLVDTVANFLSPALYAGGAAVIVATAGHRSHFERALSAAAVDTAGAATAGRYVALDAADVLSRFMVCGMPDATRYRRVVGALVAGAGAEGRPVRVYGEMVALLWEAGQVPAALALEDLWNDLAATVEFALLCAYPLVLFESGAVDEPFRHMCRQHTSVIPGREQSVVDGLVGQAKAAHQVRRGQD